MRQTPNGSGRAIGRRCGTIASVTPLVLLTAAVLLAAPVLASVTPSTTLKPPFTTAKVALANPKTVSGCGSAKPVKKAFFSTTSGVGGFSSRANSTWCPTSTNNSALVEGKVTITVPIHVSKTGIHNISVVWETIATGSVNLTAGRCAGSSTSATSSCTRFVQAFVFGTDYILDNTTQLRSVSSAPLWPGNFTAVWSNTTCHFTTCTTSKSAGATSALHTGTAFWSWDWNSFSMNSTHSYLLHMVLFGGAIVTLSVSGGATLSSAKGNAQFNSATLGQDEALVSISVI